MEWIEDDIEIDLKDLLGMVPHAAPDWTIHLSDPQWSAPVLRPNCSNALASFGWCTVLMVRMSVDLYIPQQQVACESTPAPPNFTTPCSQRVFMAGTQAQRLHHALVTRPQMGMARAGVWLLAVDPDSVRIDVDLPCLPAFEDISGCGRSADAYWNGLNVISAVLASAVVLLTSIVLAVRAGCEIACLTPARVMVMVHASLACSQLVLLLCGMAMTKARVDVPGSILLFLLIVTAFVRLSLYVCRSQPNGYAASLVTRVSSDEAVKQGMLGGGFLPASSMAGTLTNSQDDGEQKVATGSALSQANASGDGTTGGEIRTDNGNGGSAGSSSINGDIDYSSNYAES